MPVFAIFYSKMLKHFLHSHWRNLLVLSAMILWILFTTSKVLSEKILKHGVEPSAVTLFVFAIQLMLISYCSPFIHSDDNFIRQSTGKKISYILLICKYWVASLIITFLLIFFPVQMNILGVNDILLLFLLSTVSSPFLPILLQSKKTENHRSSYKNRLLQIEPDLNKTSIYPALCLNTIYFSRRGWLKTLMGSILITTATLLISAFITNTQSYEKIFLFSLPFAITALFLVDKNTDILRDLKFYTASGLKVGFFSDFIFSTTVLILQWLGTVCFLWALSFKLFPFFWVLFVSLPLVALYCTVLKFSHLNSKIMRSLSLGISIALPLAIPLFIGIFLWRLRDD